MNKRYECEKCMFYDERAFEDMHATIPACMVNPDIWDALMQNSRDYKPSEHCKLWLNKNKLIKEYKEKWKNEQ